MRKKHLKKVFKMSYLMVKKLRKIGKTVITEMHKGTSQFAQSSQGVPTGKSKYTNKYLNSLFNLLIPFICFFILATVRACTYSLQKLKWNLTKPCCQNTCAHSRVCLCVLGQGGLVSHVSQQTRCSVINNFSFELYFAL